MDTKDKLSQLKSLIRLSGYEFAYWELNLENNQLSMDEGFPVIFESTLSEDQGFTWITPFLNEKSWNKFNVSLGNLIKNSIYLDVELLVTLPDNTKKWIRVVGSFLAGNKNIISGSIQNVTKQISREVAYRNRNIELTSFEKGLEQFSIVARTDARGKITYANEEFCRLSKYSEEELLGHDHRIVNSGYHSKEFFKEMWESIKFGKNWRGIVKNKAKDGSFYWVDTIVIPMLDSSGALQEILSFRFNVTSMQEAKEENLRLRHEIECLKFDLNKEILTVASDE